VKAVVEEIQENNVFARGPFFEKMPDPLHQQRGFTAPADPDEDRSLPLDRRVVEPPGNPRFHFPFLEIKDERLHHPEHAKPSRQQGFLKLAPNR